MCGWDVVRESGIGATLFTMERDGARERAIDSAVGSGAAAILQDASSSSFSRSVLGVVRGGAGEMRGGDFPLP